MKRMFAVGWATLLVGGCAMPSTVVRTSDTRPSLAVRGAPSGSFLFVDGQNAGRAGVYDGQPNVLMVEPGTHEVDVRDPGGQVVFRQRIFVESELKTLEVH